MYKRQYLSSLPDELPDLPSWPPAERAELAGTNLGAAADAAAASLASEHAQWWPRLRAARPRLFARCDLEQLRWARSMYFSRRFPARLVAECEVRARVSRIAFLDREETFSVPLSLSKRGPSLNARALSRRARARSLSRSLSPRARQDPDEAGDAAVNAAVAAIPASAGVLLPLLDLLNHAPGARVTWAPGAWLSRSSSGSLSLIHI